MQGMNQLEELVNSNVTACLVVHNEERLISRCLGSLKRAAGRIVVVHDGLCSDRTLAICRNFGCDVFERNFVGMCEGHRIFAYSQVNTEWILQIDADEFLSEELVNHLPELLNNNDAACYEFAWPYWDGSRYRTNAWPFRRALFRKNRFQYLGFPHEEIRPLGEVVQTSYIIEHRPLYDNYSLKNLRKKHKKWIKVHASFHLKKYDELERFPADALEMKPHYAFIGEKPLLMAPFVFMYHFVGLMLLGGIRQGWYGWRNSYIQSAYYFLLCLEVYRQKNSMPRFGREPPAGDALS
jgi:glycosyltransferase involved in cell wall biosynthesis